MVCTKDIKTTIKHLLHKKQTIPYRGIVYTEDGRFDSLTHRDLYHKISYDILYHIGIGQILTIDDVRFTIIDFQLRFDDNIFHLNANTAPQFFYKHNDVRYFVECYYSNTIKWE